jgi:acetyl-CoA synthetase
MTREAVAIYLGIVLSGCAVVSIADSFAVEEIASRLRISGAVAIFTQARVQPPARPHALTRASACAMPSNSCNSCACVHGAG